MNRAVGRALLVAGIAGLGLGGCMGSNFQHNLVECLPTAGVPAVMSLSPGLTCSASKNTFKVQMRGKLGNQLDGCAANPAAPWNAWAAGKIGSKITALDAALIAKADVTFNGTMLGACGPDANSYPSMAGSGSVIFYQADGITKVKNGSATFFANVASSPAALTLLSGVVTKGIGVGGVIEIALPVDNLGPDNSVLFACNSSLACPPDPFGKNNACTAPGMPTACCTGSKTGSCVPPITKIDLKTDSTTYLRIQMPNSADCTADGVPLRCCTGLGTGTC